MLGKILQLKGKIKLNMYKKDGMIFGKNFQVMGKCKFDKVARCLIQIGDNVTLSSSVQILVHDGSTKSKLGYSKLAKVTIGNDVFIGSRAMILPGVTIGNNVIIGAGSVVRQNIPDNCVVMGNPAQIITQTDKYLQKNAERLEKSIVIKKKIKKEDFQSIREQFNKSKGYII